MKNSHHNLLFDTQTPLFVYCRCGVGIKRVWIRIPILQEQSNWPAKSQTHKDKTVIMVPFAKHQRNCIESKYYIILGEAYYFKIGGQWCLQEVDELWQMQGGSMDEASIGRDQERGYSHWASKCLKLIYSLLILWKTIF